MSNFEKVLDFHDKFNIPIGKPGSFITAEQALLRIRLMSSELSETIEAMALRDYVAIADGLADLLYTVYGTAAAYGIPINKVFDEVHSSNMTKEGRTENDGKVQKGPNYRPPDIQKVLNSLRG